VRGVYFLANDAVLDIAIAFLNSFRLYNPDIPLCLIPFNDSYTRLEELRDEYEFCIYKDDEVLAECDAISARFHNGHVFGHYRKLALWEGPFDDFIYIDVDTVVLKSIEFAFPLLDDYAFITACSNVPSAREWVWKDSIDTVDELTEEQKSFAANTGFICSRKGNLSLLKTRQALDGALSLLEHMRLFCIEQPLLNYLIVTSGLPYTSLYMRFMAGSKVFMEHWTGNDMLTSAGRVISPSHIFMVHWAGEWENGKARVGQRVRHVSLWLHYRFLRKSKIADFYSKKAC
jgi:hypothetical protein